MELDAMLGTLGFVSETDWSAVLPAIMMADPSDHKNYSIRVISDPPLTLDLILIEASRRPMSRPAEALLGHLKDEMDRLIRSWSTGRPTRRGN